MKVFRYDLDQQEFESIEDQVYHRAEHKDAVLLAFSDPRYVTNYGRTSDTVVYSPEERLESFGEADAIHEINCDTVASNPFAFESLQDRYEEEGFMNSVNDRLRRRGFDLESMDVEKMLDRIPADFNIAAPDKFFENGMRIGALEEAGVVEKDEVEFGDRTRHDDTIMFYYFTQQDL